MQLPGNFVQGEPARLFPTLSESSKEGRTVSSFLACFQSVAEFARTLLQSVNVTAGKTAKINTFTEIVPQKDFETESGRPDGLIVVQKGKETWSAFIEAKIGNNMLDASQIERYAKLAKLNGVKAIITISNQFVARPDHPPIQVGKTLIKHVSIYHWSWSYLRTVASLLISDKEVSDDDQHYLLSEFLRFLDHPSAGVTNFDQMNPEWKWVVDQACAGGTLGKNSEEIQATVASWHQELRDLSLKLSEALRCRVVTKLPRTHIENPIKRIDDDSQKLSEIMTLEGVYSVPGAAAPIELTVDIRSKSITIGMQIKANLEKKKTRSRLNWLLRQLDRSNSHELYIMANWPGKAPSTVAQLEDLRKNPEIINGPNPNRAPTSFKIFLSRNLGGRFGGRKTFIVGFEDSVLDYYEQVGQFLKAWQPSAPKVKSDNVSEEEKPSEKPTEISSEFPDQTEAP